MLEIENLSVEVDSRQLLHHINMTISSGETHVLFGPNGSGKTSLLMAIMGFARYKVIEGRIVFKGRDITRLSLDERARLGIGISFQRPPVIRGVTMRQMVLSCLKHDAHKVSVEELATKLNLSSFLDRDVNYGFSGGELKRSELLQLLAQNPELVLIDEPESGVDLVSISLVGAVINELLQKERVRTRMNAGLIITHTGHILDYVHANKGYTMVDGRLACGGNPREILDEVRRNGYQWCPECQK